MRSKVLMAGLAVIAIFVVGCGGGGGDTSGTTSSANEAGKEANKQNVSGGPSPETQLKYSANEICLNVPRAFVPAKEKMEKEYKKQGKPLPSTAEINEKYAIPPLRIAVEKFEELPEVAGREEETKELAAALKAATEGMEEKPASPFGGPGSPFGEFARLAQEAGYEACARL